MARVRKSQHHRASPAAASSSYREAQQSSPFDFPLASQPLRRTEDDKLIVSLDFGTTFSAIAFARVLKDNTLPMPDQIHNVRSWDCGGVTYRGNEVPSVLAYQNRGRADERMYWGFGVHAAIKNQEINQDDDDREELIRLGQIKRMKLALSSSEATKVLRRDIQESLSKLGPTRQSVEDLIADFLKELWKSVKSQAVSVYSDAVKHMPVECVVCIPAMWTQAEEQRMRKAIELAGLPPPHFVGEPEAAAVSMLAREAPSIIGYSGSDQFPDVDGRGTRLHVADTIIVCDAGGGTADLITYRITGTSPLQVEELVEGAGDFCGSSDLNDHFAQWLRQQMIDCGEWTDMLQYMELNEVDFLERLAAAFEEVKKGFSGSWSTTCVTIQKLRKSRRMPHLIRQDNIVLRLDDMVTIFSRTVNRIVELIIDQIDRAYDAADHNDTDFRVQRILLVGGYGESDYLYKELRTTFGRNLNPRYRVQICCHDDSATAIAKGGLLRTLNPAVVTHRISRMSMGICWSETYQKNLRAHRDKAKDEPKWCPFYHDDILENRVRWLLKVHQIVHNEYFRGQRMTRCVPLDGSFLFKDELWVSDRETEDSLRIQRQKIAQAERSNDIRLMATINTDMSHLTPEEKSRFRIGKNAKKGNEFYIIDHKLTINIKNSNIKFSEADTSKIQAREIQAREIQARPIQARQTEQSKGNASSRYFRPSSL